MSEFPTSGPSSPQTSTGMERAKEAAAETAQTAGQQARNVGGAIREQAGQAVDQVRGRVRDEADAQSRRAAQNIRQWADDLTTMTDSGKPESPMHGVLHQVAQTGHRAADYLEDRGVSGAVSDVQDFARRRPGLFLAAALAAGFLAGRAAKAGAQAVRDDKRDDYRTRRAYGTDPGAGYETGATRYPTGTTGTTGTTSTTGTTGTTSPSTYSAGGPTLSDPDPSASGGTGYPSDYRGGEPR